MKAGWQAGDGLLWLDWTLLRLFPPLRATWALTGAQAVAPITGANAKRVLFGAIDLRTAHRVVLMPGRPTRRRSSASCAGATAAPARSGCWPIARAPIPPHRPWR